MDEKCFRLLLSFIFSINLGKFEGNVTEIKSSLGIKRGPRRGFLEGNVCANNLPNPLPFYILLGRLLCPNGIAFGIYPLDYLIVG